MFISFPRRYNRLLCLLLPPPGDLPDPGIEPKSLLSPALAGGFFTRLSLQGSPFVKLVAKQSLRCVCLEPTFPRLTHFKTDFRGEGPPSHLQRVEHLL